MIIGHRVSTQLMKASKYTFAGLSFGKKREKVSSDEAKYNVVIVGGHLGPLLSSHLDAVVGAKASIFVAYDTPYYQYNPIRSFYEKGLYYLSDTVLQNLTCREILKAH